MRIAAKLFPEGFITGTLPHSLTQQKPKQITPAERKVFSRMDLDKLQIYLDGALQDNSIGSKWIFHVDKTFFNVEVSCGISDLHLMFAFETIILFLFIYLFIFYLLFFVSVAFLSLFQLVIHVHVSSQPWSA